LPAKRGDRVAPPPGEGQWDLRFANNDAAKGWEDMARQFPANARRAWHVLCTNPGLPINPARQHKLRAEFASVAVGGRRMEQWQYEVTGAGRLWYAVDDQKRVVWLTMAAPGHPKSTE